MSDRPRLTAAPGLEAADVLGQVPAPVRARLAAIAERRPVDAGASLFAEGAETPFLGLVERGRVALRLRAPEHGADITLVTIEAGELLGWSALIPPHRATVDAVATAPTEIVAWPAVSLRAAMAADGELAAAVWRLALEAVSRRLTAAWHALPEALLRTEVTSAW